MSERCQDFSTASGSIPVRSIIVCTKSINKCFVNVMYILTYTSKAIYDLICTVLLCLVPVFIHICEVYSCDIHSTYTVCTSDS